MSSLMNSLLPTRARSSSSRRPPSESTHELPLYHSPPLSPAFPPPPIAASMHQAVSSPTSPNAPIRNPARTPRLNFPSPRSEGLVLLQRREQKLEQDIQSLLDAQSEALLAGSSPNADVDDVLSIGSGTPRLLSPARSPARPKPMTPAKARRGLYHAVQELAAVKEKEMALVQKDGETCDAVLKRVERWGAKRDGLQDHIDKITAQDLHAKTRGLQQEADALQEEIVATEQRLNKMRQRHARLISEIETVGNAVEGELTSYTSALAMLEADIEKFLKRPPSPVTNTEFNKTFVGLPASRRTLDMARDVWDAQAAELAKRSKSIRREKRALDQGARLWKSCIAKIESFERHLGAEMRAMQGRPSGTRMTDLLASLDEVLKSLEEDLAKAEKEGWTLLRICIGAEVEAFREGKKVLEEAAGLKGTAKGKGKVQQDMDGDGESLLEQSSRDSMERDEEEEEGQITVWNTPRASGFLRNQPQNDGDDEPDMELMISKAREID